MATAASAPQRIAAGAAKRDRRAASPLRRVPPLASAMSLYTTSSSSPLDEDSGEGASPWALPGDNHNPADELSASFKVPSISICIEGDVGCATSIYGGRLTTNDCLESSLKYHAKVGYLGLFTEAHADNQMQYYPLSLVRNGSQVGQGLLPTQADQMSCWVVDNSTWSYQSGFSMDILAVWDTNFNKAKYAVQARGSGTLFQSVADVWIWQGVYDADGNTIEGAGAARKLAPMPLTIYQGPYGTGINSAIDYYSSTYQLTRSRLKYVGCPSDGLTHCARSAAHAELRTQSCCSGSRCRSAFGLPQPDERTAFAASAAAQNGSYAMFYNGVVSTATRYSNLYLNNYDEDASGHLGPAARPEPLHLDNVAIAKIYMSLDPGIYTMFYEVNPNWFTIASTVYGLWPAVLAVFGLLFTTRIASRRYLVCKGPKEQLFYCMASTTPASFVLNDSRQWLHRAHGSVFIARPQVNSVPSCAHVLGIARLSVDASAVTIGKRCLSPLQTGSLTAATSGTGGSQRARTDRQLTRTRAAAAPLPPPPPQLLTPRVVHRTRAVVSEYGVGADADLERDWFKDTRLRLSSMSARTGRSQPREAASPKPRRGSGSSSAMTLPALERVLSERLVADKDNGKDNGAAHTPPGGLGSCVLDPEARGLGEQRGRGSDATAAPLRFEPAAALSIRSTYLRGFGPAS
ncbi:hypothetical protein JKP88DRAFT_241632 [Tribonema minus]|uniref:Uncharacterized protein n=1 Tax=Tribonema minus TaxID=303371 RepID=A0A835YTL8_9STRA|nr:hypothetical protein JKP88DRAFT_241632 [Tribonema minus]